MKVNGVRYIDVTKRTILERGGLRVFVRDHDVPRFDRSLFVRPKPFLNHCLKD